MPALTPFELELLEVVDHHRWYPASLLAKATHRSLPIVATALEILHRAGYVDAYRSESLGQQAWALTQAGRHVLAGRHGRAKHPMVTA